MPTMWKKLLLVVLLPVLAMAAMGANSAGEAGLSWQQQDDDPQPLDDEFVEALVIMAVDYDMMAGDNEFGYLLDLRDYVSTYYQARINSLKQAGAGEQDINALIDQGMVTVQKLQARINREKEAARWLISMLDTLTGTDRDFAPGYKDPGIPVAVVSGEPDPPPDYFNTMNSLIMTDFEAQINLLLDIHTVTVQPQIAPAIADLSAWQASAGIASSGSTTMANPEGEISSNQVDGVGQVSDETRPIRFSNNGFVTVTVLVESYEPAPGYPSAKPSASTVVSSEANSSAYLDLPLGTYTFCYEWQLEGDVNGDDYFDYHHRSTSAVTLSTNSSANQASAKLVNLSPDSAVSNPNGKCGDTSDQEGYQMTAAEIANQGTFTYSCLAADGSAWTDPITFSFSDDGVLMTYQWTIPLDREMVRLEGNRYRDMDSEILYTVQFSAEGYQYDNPKTGGLTRCQRQ